MNRALITAQRGSLSVGWSAGRPDTSRPHPPLFCRSTRAEVKQQACRILFTSPTRSPSPIHTHTLTLSHTFTLTLPLAHFRCNIYELKRSTNNVCWKLECLELPMNNSVCIKLLEAFNISTDKGCRVQITLEKNERNYPAGGAGFILQDGVVVYWRSERKPFY